jgi:hypothetical protein
MSSLGDVTVEGYRVEGEARFDIHSADATPCWGSTWAEAWRELYKRGVTIQGDCKELLDAAMLEYDDRVALRWTGLPMLCYRPLKERGTE